MALIEDVNNKVGQHVLKNDYWASVGEKVVRCHLPYGDYQLPAPIVVDTKRTVDELAANIDNDHVRFRNACILARECGSKLVILTENDLGIRSLNDLTRWENPRNSINEKKGLRPPISGLRLAKACATMERKYGVKFEFCAPSEAGERVMEILKGGGKHGGNDDA